MVWLSYQQLAERFDEIARVTNADPWIGKFAHLLLECLSHIHPVCDIVTLLEGMFCYTYCFKWQINFSLFLTQDRLVKSHGIQCGFCTPGMIMSLYALLRNNAQPSPQQVEHALQGMICSSDWVSLLTRRFHADGQFGTKTFRLTLVTDVSNWRRLTGSRHSSSIATELLLVFVFPTSGSAMAEGPRDAPVSRNSATTKHPIWKL